MKPIYFYAAVMVTGILTGACTGRNEPQKSFLLRDNWAIQSSKETGADGKTISAAAYQPEKWYPATVPSTVFGTLVENKVYPDPYYGTNIQKIPGYIARRAGDEARGPERFRLPV